MRQTHKGGEKTFVDFSGRKPSYVDPTTGEVVEVELVVAVLGASNLTHAVAVPTQQVEDWTSAHNGTVEYFGGVTEAFVPDCLKSGITRPCRYEPTIQRTYLDWARHHGSAVVPARPYKPRDKAKVEVGVQIAQRWILARLRNETFFSLEALNRRIRELCDELNLRPMKRLGGKTRRELFESLDRPYLKPLPETRYVLTIWENVTVTHAAQVHSVGGSFRWLVSRPPKWRSHPVGDAPLPELATEELPEEGGSFYCSAPILPTGSCTTAEDARQGRALPASLAEPQATRSTARLPEPARVEFFTHSQQRAALPVPAPQTPGSGAADGRGVP
jgi:hypothetical protein